MTSAAMTAQGAEFRAAGTDLSERRRSGENGDRGSQGGGEREPGGVQENLLNQMPEMAIPARMKARASPTAAAVTSRFLCWWAAWEPRSR